LGQVIIQWIYIVKENKVITNDNIGGIQQGYAQWRFGVAFWRNGVLAQWRLAIFGRFCRVCPILVRQNAIIFTRHYYSQISLYDKPLSNFIIRGLNGGLEALATTGKLRSKNAFK